MYFTSTQSWLMAWPLGSTRGGGDNWINWGQHDCTLNIPAMYLGALPPFQMPWRHHRHPRRPCVAFLLTSATPTICAALPRGLSDRRNHQIHCHPTLLFTYFLFCPLASFGPGTLTHRPCGNGITYQARGKERERELRAIAKTRRGRGLWVQSMGIVENIN